jgi:hypothetical protein
MTPLFISSALVALTSTALGAQVQTPGTSGSQQSITLMGCVGPAGTPAAPMTLTNATRLAPTTVPEPSTVSPPPSTSPTGTPSVTAGTAGATGTTGVTGTAGVAGTTAGTTGTMTGSVTPPAIGVPNPAGLPPSTYQLSGTSMSSYVGQNVQVTGTLVPSTNVAATAGAQSSGVTRPTGGTDVVGATPPAVPAIPEFRVTRVEPLGIRCPQ